MADEILEVVGPGDTVVVVDEPAAQVIELDTGGQTGPAGPAGPTGPAGMQGVQGRFNVDIFQRATTAPTAAPTGGSFDVDTGTLTAPTGWFTSPGAATGTGDLYQARTVIDPATQTGTITPTWSVPFQAGGTGPAGPVGPAGADGDTYIPIFFDRTGQGGNVANATLTLESTDAFFTFVVDSDTRVFNSDGTLVSDINAQLETLINNFVIGQHAIGQGPQGPAGEPGPRGPAGPAGPSGEADNVFPVDTLPTDGNRPDGMPLEDGDIAVLTSVTPHQIHIWNADLATPAFEEQVDTTYTFANGTDGTFTVTPLGGTAQTVDVGAGGIASGATLPTTGTEAGDGFILTAVDGGNQPGYYYRNAANDAWVRDDTDTTYTFASGTGGTFTVTPLGGAAQTVNVGQTGIPSGNTLPTTGTTAGDEFILLQTDGDNLPGVYFRNADNDAWVTTPATWAINGDTTAIPGNKLGALNDTAPDPQSLFEIDASWLPDYVSGIGEQPSTLSSPDRVMISLTLTSGVDPVSELPANTTTSFIAEAVPQESFSLTPSTTVLDLRGSRTTVDFDITIVNNIPGGFAPTFEVMPLTGVTFSTTTPTSGAAVDFTATVDDINTVANYDVTVVGTFRDDPLSAATRTVTQQATIAVIDNRNIGFQTAAEMYDPAAGAAYAVTVEELGGADIVESSIEYQFRGNGQENDITPTANFLSTSLPHTAGVWGSTGAATLTVVANETNAPDRNYSITRNITVFNAHFFWTADRAPAAVSDFSGQIDNNIAAGQSLTTTGNAIADWYLAYPTAAGTFRYLIEGSAIVSVPRPVTGTFTRNGVAYSVFLFRGVTGGTIFDVRATS